MAPLTGPEKGRAHKLFSMMDVDNSKTVSVDEIVIVHDSNKEDTIAALDTNNDGEVDKDEWIAYLEGVKAKKGEHKFGHFLTYLEVEIPKNLPELKIANNSSKLNKGKPVAPKKKKKGVPAAKKEKAPRAEPEDPFGVFMPGVSDVPESFKKKRERDQAMASKNAETKANEKASRKVKRCEAYYRAEGYVQEYRALAKQQVRMRRQAKAAGNHFVEAESKLIFVVRIRGLADMHPKTKKIMSLMRLIQNNMGVFMKASKAATEMLKRVEPYLSYGYPTLKSVRDLIYKRGFGKVNKQRIPLLDNSVIEGTLGQYGIKCMEDLVHEIYTVGPFFREANNFLWPFKLRPAKGGQAKKRLGFNEGGQAGNREENMNALIQRML